MAEPFRRASSKLWLIKWRSAQGKWITRTTKARNKDEARDLLRAEESTVERQRRGLEPLPGDCKWTLKKLREWWLDNKCPEPSRDNARLQLRKHTKSIEHLPLPAITTDLLETRFDEMASTGSGPATINKVRTLLHSAFERAKKSPARWMRNPVSETEPREVPKRHYELLTIAQMHEVLRAIPPQWLNFIAAGVFTAMRRGEVCGAEKHFVDLPSRTLLVAASHQRPTTKGKRWRSIPISDAFMPFVLDALQTPGPWLFPDEAGKQRSREADPHLVLRGALERIGITRHVRLHDLRHSIATELLRRTNDIGKVSKALGHAKISTTFDLYGHLVAEDLRSTFELLGAPVVHVAPRQLLATSEKSKLHTNTAMLECESYPVRTGDPYRVKVETQTKPQTFNYNHLFSFDGTNSASGVQTYHLAPFRQVFGAPLVQRFPCTELPLP